jgi:hypothetical protein
VPEKFPDSDPDKIKRPLDLNEYFAKVLDINYRTRATKNIVKITNKVGSPSEKVEEVLFRLRRICEAVYFRWI